MAKPCLLCVSLGLVLLFHGCLARSSQFQQFQNECQINRLESIGPVTRVQSEAGFTEWWNHNSQQLRCAGVAVLRETVEPQGLVLPSFSNAHQAVHIVKGSGVVGIILPGCPATFQDSQSQRVGDQHQKIQRFRPGDVIVLPAGVVHWFYNDGNQPFVTVAFLDVGNTDNQLDKIPIKFHLAGNPEEEQRKLQRLQQQKQGTESEEEEGEEDERRQCTNSLCFRPEYLAQAFNVEEDIIRKLQEQGNSGTIIRVKNFQFIEPPRVQQQHEEERQRGGENGVYCFMKMKENIGEPERADIFNPEAGRITSLNSFKIPLLTHLGFSAERGVLFNKAGLVPQWTMNAHRIIYMVKGRARFQVVNQNGESVLDDYVEQGQVVTVPQNFAFMKRAGNEGAEWVSFYTNDNAKNTPMAGVGSFMQGVPEEVVAAAYQISKQEARDVKFNNQNNFFFTSSSRPQPRAEA